jgi:hypothetical protein
VYKNLIPGGWLEMASMDINSYSNNSTHLKAVNLVKWIKNMHLALKKYGKRYGISVHIEGKDRES